MWLGGGGPHIEPQIFQHRFMVSVLTLPIKASHLLAPLTGARHHVLEGAEPAGPRRKGLKENPSLEEGKRGRGTGGREEEVGEQPATPITATLDSLKLQRKLKKVENKLESE